MGVGVGIQLSVGVGVGAEAGVGVELGLGLVGGCCLVSDLIEETHVQQHVIVAVRVHTQSVPAPPGRGGEEGALVRMDSPHPFNTPSAPL